MSIKKKESGALHMGLSCIASLEERILNGGAVSEDEALALVRLEGHDIHGLMASANRVRHHFKGNSVNLCSIVSAKSGLCAEDCSFCGQSSHYETGVKTHSMLPADRIAEAAREAEGRGANEFSIVTSGTAVDKDGEIDTLAEALSSMKETTGLERCASLGILDGARLQRLKEAGLQSYHHNLETARSFFPSICTTHDYDDTSPP